LLAGFAPKTPLLCSFSLSPAAKILHLGKYKKYNIRSLPKWIFNILKFVFAKEKIKPNGAKFSLTKQ
jgi:hypothetical protein